VVAGARPVVHKKKPIVVAHVEPPPVAAVAVPKRSAAISIPEPQPAPPAPPSSPPGYRRSAAVASMDAFCHVPYDAAHPDPATYNPIADWGRVTKVEREVGSLAEERVPLDIVYLAGQRKTYRFSTDGLEGIVPANVGDWLVVCRESDSDVYQLPGGPLDVMRSVITVSGPPRITELAKLAPLHIYEIMLWRFASLKKIEVDPARRYLVNAKVTEREGSRLHMDKWWLDVPAGIPGASSLVVGKRAWIVVEKLHFEDDDKLVGRAAAVVDDLFR
jgi:hypothetical protein